MSVIRSTTFKHYRWAVVAVFALLLCVGLGAGLLNRKSNLAFADVMERIRSVKTLTFTSTAHVPNNPPEMQTMTYKIEYMEPGKQRQIEANGNIIITDTVAMKSMSLIPSQKKGAIIDFSKMPQKNQQMNFVGMLQQLQDHADMVLGQKEIDGKIAILFVVKQEGLEHTIWADLKTGLPVRVEVKMAMFGDMQIAMTDFVFNPDLDESLFKIELPPGYEEIKMPEMDASQPTEKDLIDALRLVTEKIKTFPESLTLQDMAKQLGGQLGNGEPNNEQIKEFTAQFMKLSRGLVFMQQNVNNDWHYEGKGAQLGDAKPICWWKPQGSQTYRVIYGNLSAADVSPDQFTKDK